MSSLSSFGLLGATVSSVCEVPVAMWSPGAEAVSAWVDYLSGPVEVDWSMYTALSVSAKPGFQVGYCYAPLLDATVSQVVVDRLGPFPSLASLLQAPLDIFDVERLSMRVDLCKRRVLHVTQAGAHEFGRLAVTAISGIGYDVEPGSLAEYVLNMYAAVPRLKLDTGWRVGAAVTEVEAMVVRLSELSGIAVGNFDRLDIDAVVRTAALATIDQKTRFRVVESIGDAAIDLLVSLRVFSRGLVVQYVQDARTMLANNAHVAGLADAAGLLDLVQFVPGVPRLGKVGANHFEAMVGAVYRAGDMAAVSTFVDKVNLFDKFPVLK